MISFKDYLIGVFKLNDYQYQQLLRLDKLYGDYYVQYRKAFNARKVLNVDEEKEKFFKFRKLGVQYYPQLKIDFSGVNKELIDLGKRILKEFELLDDIILKKYYIELLELYIHRLEYAIGELDVDWYTSVHNQTPSYENYMKALDIVKEHPFEEIEEKTDITPEEAKKELQKYIDKKNFPWKAELKDCKLIRVQVIPDGHLYIKKDAKFSKADIEGLKVHEIDAHIGRRYYGLQTGLHLFEYGLLWQNTLNEGLAVYNSIHKTKEEKPNVWFNIAIKTIIAYQLDKMDFCQLFDFITLIAPEFPEEKIFTNILRYKREVQDCSIIGGNGDDQSYFCGYQIVKNLTAQQREDILHFNIGPGQINDLPYIKEFFKLNKFKPLDL